MAFLVATCNDNIKQLEKTKEWEARRTAFEKPEKITWVVKGGPDQTMRFYQWPFGMYVIETYLPAAGVLASRLLAR